MPEPDPFACAYPRALPMLLPAFDVRRARLRRAGRPLLARLLLRLLCLLLHLPGLLGLLPGLLLLLLSLLGLLPGLLLLLLR